MSNKLNVSLCLWALTALVTPLAAAETKQPASQFGQAVEDWQVRLELAKVLSYQKRYADAVKQYRSVLAVKPQLPEAKIGLAEVLVHIGKQKEANRLIAELEPASLAAGDTIRLANLLASSKQFRQAQELLKNYLEAHPDDLTARFNYAEILSWDKQYADSLAQYEALLEARPDDSQLRRKYALVLIWSGDTDRAKRELERTLSEPTQ